MFMVQQKPFVKGGGVYVKIRSMSKSIDSKKCSRNDKSDNPKTRAIEEKAKLAELLVEESFLIKQHMTENEAEKLKLHQEIANAKGQIKNV